jgi:hypothetical protein
MASLSPGRVGKLSPVRGLRCDGPAGELGSRRIRWSPNSEAEPGGADMSCRSGAK